MSAQEKLIVFDTTLRDGEQSPGVTLSLAEKVEIARHLSKMRVDVCEAGFPASSEGEFRAVSEIASKVGHEMLGRESLGQPMVIAGLSRAIARDVERTFEAVKHAPRHRIHVFLATSDIHLEYKLKISREQCIERAVKAVSLAASLCKDVEFSPEDAARTDKDFLVQILGQVIAAGATTLNIPDTVGICTPHEYRSLFEYLIANTKGADKVTWSAHCQNDLGLATANTLAAIEGGVRQVEVTINGIGERAGNTSLEEVVMSIYTHPGYYPIRCDIDTTLIYSASQLVLRTSGMPIQPHKAIVGANAFAHESGVHQDGVLKNPLTYEIIEPSVVGVPTNSLVLGKLSGRAAFRSKLIELGVPDLTEELVSGLFTRFKDLADKKKSVTDHDLLALIADENAMGAQEERWKLEGVLVMSGSGVISTATVTLEDRDSPGTVIVDAATGAGPVEAVFAALARITGVTGTELGHYEVRSVGSGSDALAQVFLKIRKGDDSPNSVWSGVGTDNDTIGASARAYLNAINRMLMDSRNGKF
ncbi:MAG: 2-isopropylmalate synthase [Piptocephalis tieghemiana]|nr:MAG: 2-isopropylmalate synthase [Piptocephalis tieghemiana]